MKLSPTATIQFRVARTIVRIGWFVALRFRHSSWMCAHTYSSEYPSGPERLDLRATTETSRAPAATVTVLARKPITARGLCARPEPVKNPGLCVPPSYHP